MNHISPSIDWRTLRQYAVVAGCVGSVLLMYDASRTETALLVYIGVDRSGSTHKVRHRYLGLMDVVVAEGLPSGATISVWRFDTRAEQVYEGRTSRSQDIWQAQDNQLRRSAAHEGSLPGELLRRINSDLRHRTEQRVALVILWDGENTGATMRGLVEQLASNRHLRVVWLVGINPEFRSRVKNNFRSFGTRVIVSGLDDMQSGFDQFRRKLNER